MGSRKLICIYSPYAGDVDRNEEVARKLYRQAIDACHAPLALHLHYLGIVDDSNEEERAAGIYADDPELSILRLYRQFTTRNLLKNIIKSKGC